MKKIQGTPLPPQKSRVWADKREKTQKKLLQGSETSDMTFDGMGEMFEGDSADTCAGKFPLVSMGGRAEGLTCADPGARTPIGASGNFDTFLVDFLVLYFKILVDFLVLFCGFIKNQLRLSLALYLTSLAGKSSCQSAGISTMEWANIYSIATTG